MSYKIDFEKIESITEVIFSKPIISLTIILLLGFLLRVFFTPFDLQSRSNDAFVFLLYALEFQNSLDYIGGQYFMWSGLLAIFFIPFHFDNYDGYFTVLEIVSISISTLSGIVLYFIAKKIIHKKFALLATAFFVLEPNIIENSIFGVTEPLFILIGLCSFYFAIQKNTKLLLLSFIFAGLAFDTRPNGIILLIIALSSIYFQKQSKKQFLKLGSIGILLFLIAISPVLIDNLGNVGYIGLLDSETRKNTPSFELVSGYSDNIYVTAFITDIVHIFRISVPYLILFAPIGFFLSLKRLDLPIKLIIITILSSIIIAIPQYTVSVEFRNLFFITPFLALFSALGIEYFVENKKAKNLLIIFLVIGLLVTSYNFLREMQPDPELILEKEMFGKFVVTSLKGNISGEDWIFIEQNMKWISVGIVDEIQNPLYFVKPNYVIHNADDLVEFIKDRKIDYLIISAEEGNRFKIFPDIYFNEEKYPYMENIFNSDEHDYKKYRNKIFKINQEKLI